MSQPDASRPRPPLWPRRLTEWYCRTQRPLPWRIDPTPYRVWISEVMLQQTQVITAVPYFTRFLERFPTLASLAAAEVDDVLLAWRGLGYYTRARHLHEAARQVQARFGGDLPRDAATLRTLPGIGHYTAAAIASIAFGEAIPVVDGNVLRVGARFWALPGTVRSAALRNEVFQRLTEAIQTVVPGDFNQAMMELGATLCRPTGAVCSGCPLARDCLAFRHNAVTAHPAPLVRVALPHHEVAVAIVVEGDRFLVTRRPDDAMLGGLWELPGGKIEPSESPRQAVRRECREELGVAVTVMSVLPPVGHAYSHFSVTLHPFVCRLGRGRSLSSPDGRQMRWVTLAESGQLPMPRGTEKVLQGWVGAGG